MNTAVGEKYVSELVQLFEKQGNLSYLPGGTGLVVGCSESTGSNPGTWREGGRTYPGVQYCPLSSDGPGTLAPGPEVKYIHC